jgi:hypothetical protein
MIPRELHTGQYFMVQFSKYCNMQKVIADITQQYQLTDKQVAQNKVLLGMLGQSDALPGFYQKANYAVCSSGRIAMV